MILQKSTTKFSNDVSVKSEPKKQDGRTSNNTNPTNLNENDQICDKDVSKVEAPENGFPNCLLEQDYTIKPEKNSTMYSINQ